MSLAELLIAMALTLTITGAVLSAVGQAQMAFVAQAEAADTCQRLRVAVDTLTRHLQAATAVAPTHDGVLRADAITIREGSVTRAYYHSDSQLRQDTGAQTAPVVDRITGLGFEYFGEAGSIEAATLADGPWLPSAADPARVDADALAVRRVRVRVTSAPARGPALTAVVDVALRNVAGGGGG